MEIMMRWAILGFLSGSIPFSLILGRIFSGVDVRQYGDGNPGGYNAWLAGGWKVGLAAGLLDGFKAFIPFSLAQAAGVSGWALVPVGLAPILGHAFSPLISFRGGKAIAATLGIWLQLRGVQGLMVFALFALVAVALQHENAWAPIAGMLGLSLSFTFQPLPDYLLALWFANLGLLLLKHWRELRQPIELRPWAGSMIGGNRA